MDISQQDRALTNGRRRLRLLVIVFGILLGFTRVAPAAAGTVWTDADGDGLPDGYNLFVFPGTVLVVDVWIDSQSFAFTAYQVTVEQSGMILLDAEYLISGGSNAPIDSTSRVNSVVFAGSGYDDQGVKPIGRLRYEVGFDCGFARPVIDAEDPYACRLSASGGSDEFYFESEFHTYTTLGEWFDPHTCCLPDGSCLITYEFCECEAAGGLHVGEGMICEECASATAVPPAGASLHTLAVVPNPTAGVVRLAFRLDRDDEIDLSVYDSSGRRIRSLVSGSMPVGVQTATWDRRDDGGNEVAAGIYFLRLRVGDGHEATERVTIVR